MAGLLANKGKPLGLLRGIFFTNGDNRNDYPCTDTSAKNAESEELMQEKLITGGVIGRLDHTNHSMDANPNDETLIKEAAVNVLKFPRRNNKGQYEGEALILDTPDGQKLYAYCKSGKKPGVSYRGAIDEDAYNRNDMDAAWRNFVIEGFDIVYVPAYEECYLELVEDYLDPEAEPITAKRRAGINAVGAARAMIKVAASKKGAKEMTRVMAQEKHFTEAEALEINKAIDSANIDGNKRTKELVDALGTPYEAKPKHTWTRQEGNGTIDMHHEEAIYGEDDVDELTGQKIETLNTGNTTEKDRDIPNRTIKSSLDQLQKKVDELADDVANKLVEEKLEKKQVKSSTKAGIQKGMVADKDIDEEDELEGYVDKPKDGKPVKSGVLGVQSEEQKDEEDKLSGYVGKDGKVAKQTKSAITNIRANKLGVAADEDPEVVVLTDDGIKGQDTEIVEDEAVEYSEEATIEQLVEEITKLTEEIASLREAITSKDTEISNRDSGLEEVQARNKRLKRTMASTVEKLEKVKTVQAQNANLLSRNENLSIMLTKQKREHRQVVAKLEAENRDYKSVVAKLETDRDTQNRTLKVQASTLRQQTTDNMVLAGKNDNLGKLCIRMVAEMLEVDEGKLLQARGRIRTSADLNKVLASLQRPRRAVNASYYPITQGMESALPYGIEDICSRVDWDDEEDI